MDKNNISLIGLPTCGKTVIGQLLANHLGWSWMDTDAQMEQMYHLTIPQILSNYGRGGFLQKENDTLLQLEANQCVISTGGSVVYCKTGMEYLKSISKLIYIYIDGEVLERRLTNPRARGVIKGEDQSLSELWKERHQLCLEFADEVVTSIDNEPLETVQQILMAGILS